jgi:hypothetical protein
MNPIDELDSMVDPESESIAGFLPSPNGRGAGGEGGGLKRLFSIGHFSFVIVRSSVAHRSGNEKCKMRNDKWKMIPDLLGISPPNPLPGGEGAGGGEENRKSKISKRISDFEIDR